MPESDRRGPAEPLRLVRRAPASQAPPVLDDSQRRVVEHRRGDGPMIVLGAPGTGKTTTLVESVVARVGRDGLDPASVLVLAPSRLAAAELRDRVTARLDRTVTEPLARTPQAFAYALARRAATSSGEPPPRLISGPEQDRVLADLLAGHRAGEGAAPDWPDAVRPALALRGFRDELRDLLMRALERGLTAQDLQDLGRDHGRQEWVAAAGVLAEYLDVTALATPGAYDPAAVVDHAVALLENDPDLLRAERERWRLVAVDDHHESGEALARLLDLLVGRGGDLMVFGDPDATTQGFRGADPALLAAAPQRHRRADGREAAVVRLSTRWRASRDVAAATQRVATTIGTVGTAEHRAAGVPEDAAQGSVEAAVLRSATQEAAYVAHLMRDAHLRGGLGWSQMAVVVRSSRQTGSLRRGLALAGVPVRVPTGEVPVRDEPAVRPLRLALRVALRPEALDPDTAVELLTSPVGGADALALRRLRRALRAEERAGGGGRASDELLVEALASPAYVASLDDRTGRPATRVATVLEAGRTAAARPDAGAEDVLWAIWSATRLAGAWRRQALAGGPAGDRADRALDALVALFDAAGRFADRLPGADPAAFADHLDAQDVPADTLAEQAPSEQAVSLVTAQGSAGREWDLVVVAGVQEGVWPNTRLRGSLLGAQALVDVLSGRDDPTGVGARAQVLADERRLLHVAVSRARSRVVVTGVRDSDERPSSFMDLASPLRNSEERPLSPLPRPVSLPALVAELRQAVLSDGGARDQAARQLARLAEAGVPGAHPDDWYGLAPLSDDGPLRSDDEPVRVSPSKVEAFGRCPLRWLLEASGGTTVDSASQSVGNLVHEIAAEAPDAGADELAAMLAERWAGLGLPSTWVGTRERRKADDMVARLAGYLAANRRELVAVEEDFEVELGRARLRGRVDRLERDDDGALVVVDLKTGRSKPKADELDSHAQLGTYQAAVDAGAFAVHGGASGGASLVQVGGTNARYAEQQQRALADADDPTWARELVLDVADGMAGAAFHAVDNDLCRRCPVRSACPVQPEGRQVGT
ncbi:MAG TPA: ATP-dependent DNA helicase [Actinomycetales bacterium]|nr:ATP-dependent DNA helicase [Actinomycetales bacterium]